MHGLARVAAPTAAAIALRAAQLAVLVSMTAIVDNDSRAALIASAGAIAAVAVISDSGAANFIVTEGSALRRGTFLRAVQLHGGIVFVGTGVGIWVCALRFPLNETPEWLAVGTLAFGQALDSCIRVVRSSLLVSGDDHLFAAIDVVVAVSKVPWIAAAVFARDLSWFAGMVATSGVLLLGVLVRYSPQLRPGNASRGTVRRVLVFGANGAASALYSQGPLLVAGLTLPAALMASLTLCFRVTQPLELIPATLGQQIIPRAAAGHISPLKTWCAFVVLGVSVMAAIIWGQEVVEFAFTFNVNPAILLPLIAIALPLKFGNYALVAFVFARGYVVHKLALSAALGTGVVCTSAVVASRGSAVGIAALSLIAEVLLMVGLVHICRKA